MENKILLKILSIYIFCVLLSATSQAQAELQVFPNAKILNQDRSSQDERFQIAAGSVRRFNSLLNPELEMSITGRKESKTLSSLKRRNVEEVTKFYLEQFKGLNQDQGEVIFDCKGRSCGPSTYWANKIFKNALLYGPEQYQRYLLIHVKAPQEYYFILYIAQRATGQVYIQEEIIWVQQSLGLKAQIIEALNEKSLYVLPEKINEEVVTTIEQVITEDKESKYLLVIHEGSEGAKSTIEMLTKPFANKALMSNIDFYNAGPMHSSKKSKVSRVELVKLSF